VSFVSELVVYTITVAYNLAFAYPFSTYGDIAACWLQNIVVVGLIFRFNKQLPLLTKAAISFSLLALSGWLFSGACSEGLLKGVEREGGGACVCAWVGKGRRRSAFLFTHNGVLPATSQILHPHACCCA
jgi:hypothetical protein